MDGETLMFVRPHISGLAGPAITPSPTPENPDQVTVTGMPGNPQPVTFATRAMAEQYVATLNAGVQSGQYTFSAPISTAGMSLDQICTKLRQGLFNQQQLGPDQVYQCSLWAQSHSLNDIPPAPPAELHAALEQQQTQILELQTAPAAGSSSTASTASASQAPAPTSNMAPASDYTTPANPLPQAPVIDENGRLVLWSPLTPLQPLANRAHELFARAAEMAESAPWYVWVLLAFGGFVWLKHRNSANG